MEVDLSKLINKGQPVQDVVAYVPDQTFTDLPIDQNLKENIVSKGYLLPTPIRTSRSRMCSRARTSSASPTPAPARRQPSSSRSSTPSSRDRSKRILIMVPTRELAIQIEEEFYGFTRRLNIHAVTCVGGANIQPQIRGLRRNPNFVIGTPGRLKDLIDRKDLDLSGFGTVVLDEADRMLDMGFIGDMKEIMGYMPRKRHTLFFSATLSRDIESSSAISSMTRYASP